jgi:hypothetical protein
MMENLSQYLSPELAFIVPALWIIGAYLKATPKVKDFVIIYTLLVLGVVASVVTIGFNAQGVSQGIVASGLAVLGHQLIKQTKKK